MGLTDQQLWISLKKRQLTCQELLPEIATTTWYIKVLMGFSAWISACFLFSFLAIVVFLSEIENGYLAIVVGVFSCAIAFAMFNTNKQSVFSSQFALAFNLSGQLLISFGLYMVIDDISASHTTAFTNFISILLCFQLIMSFIMPNYISRVLSSWFAMMALYFVLVNLGISVLSLPVVAVLFICVWCSDQRWGKKRDVWEPIGYGLALSLIMFSGNVLAGFYLHEIADWLTASNDPYLYGYWLNNAVITLCFGALLKIISDQYQVLIRSKAGVCLVLLAIFFSLLSFFIAGVSAGFLLVLIGFFKQRKLLVAMGVLSLLGFVSWYYYSLNWTLLYKSMVLMGLGALFAAVLLAMQLADKKNTRAAFKLKNFYVLNIRNVIVIVMMALILSAVNFNIYQKETLLSEGKVVLLTLAPVDPRSLMQGDYMRLRFAIERGLSDTDKAIYKGVIVADLDHAEVASFNSLYSGQALAENQIKLRFNLRNNKLEPPTDAFFFQEGTGESYEAAKYGEFRVAENGELLLNALRDKDYKVIGYNRPGN